MYDGGVSGGMRSVLTFSKLDGRFFKKRSSSLLHGLIFLDKTG